MKTTPLLTPPSLYQRYMPADVQETLANYGVRLPAFDIMVDDYGVATAGAEALAEYVADQCWAVEHPPTGRDLVGIVARVAAHFARRERTCPT